MLERRGVHRWERDLRLPKAPKSAGLVREREREREMEGKEEEKV